MVMEFDHVGLIVRDTKEMVLLFSSLFDFKISESNQFLREGFSSTLITKGKVTIELIEPIGTEGIIQKFIQKNGYGLHHISLRVDDLEQELARLESKGVKLVNKEPRRITDTSRIAFMHPSSAGGLLIELIHREESQVESDQGR